MLLDLENLRSFIEKLAAEKKLLVLPAMAHTDAELPLIDYSPASPTTSPEDQVKHFLELAAQLKPPVLVLETLKLTDDAIAEALAQIEDVAEGQERKTISIDELKRLRKDVEACRAHVGKTDLLLLRFPVPGTTFFYAISFYQQWNELIYETDVLLDGGIEIVSSSLSKEQKKKLVEAVGAHQDFAAANGNADIDSLMAAVAEKQGVKIPEYVWSEIRAAAKAYFTAKVRPELLRGILKRAKQLIAEGRSRVEIARELGVTPAVLARLLRGR